MDPGRRVTDRGQMVSTLVAAAIMGGVEGATIASRRGRRGRLAGIIHLVGRRVTHDMRVISARLWEAGGGPRLARING